jgi:cbb3-type cytochrome oxidase subunit 1
MHGLQTAHAPSSKIVIPHFIAGGIAFLIATLLILLSPEAFVSGYHHNKLIAITHIILLGWGGMMVFGALYQLIPVVYETSLFSEKLALVTFWLFAVSVPFCRIRSGWDLTRNCYFMLP